MQGNSIYAVAIFQHSIQCSSNMQNLSHQSFSPIIEAVENLVLSIPLPSTQFREHKTSIPNYKVLARILKKSTCTVPKSNPQFNNIQIKYHSSNSNIEELQFMNEEMVRLLIRLKIKVNWSSSFIQVLLHKNS